MSDLTDYRDFDESCIARTFQQRYNINVATKAKAKSDTFCDHHINVIEKSFYDSVADLISPEHRRGCVIDLLKRHQVADLFVKAIGYKYFEDQLVKFSPNKTCEGLVEVLRKDHRCDLRELKVNLISDKQQWKLLSCIDDLFGANKVDVVTFVNQKNAKIGVRKFGNHMSSFMSTLAEIGKTYCSDLNLDLVVTFFDIVNVKLQEHNGETVQSQLDCFLSFFKHNMIDGPKQIKDSPELLKCNKMMQDKVESGITLRLFGLTEPSQRVKHCIIKRNSFERYIEKVIVMPRIMKYVVEDIDIEIAENIFVKNSKKIVEITLSCLKLF